MFSPIERDYVPRPVRVKKVGHDRRQEKYLNSARVARSEAARDLSEFKTASQDLCNLLSDKWVVARQQDPSAYKKFSTHIADLRAMQLELQQQLSFATERVTRQELAMGIRKYDTFGRRPPVMEPTTKATKAVTSPVCNLANKNVSPFVRRLYADTDSHDSDEEDSQYESNFQEEAITKYKAQVTDSDGNDKILCHVLGPRDPDEVFAAHIVQPRLDEGACQDYFGLSKSELDGPSNSLLLSKEVKSLFDNHKIIIVPSPCAFGEEWHIEVLASDILETPVTPEIKGKDLHGQCLKFDSRSYHRPRESFLYFHFIISMIRIWDEMPAGWEGVWAKYGQNNPFPGPGKYVKITLIALGASMFGGSMLRDSMMQTVDWWLTNHGPDLILESHKEREERKLRTRIIGGKVAFYCGSLYPA